MAVVPAPRKMMRLPGKPPKDGEAEGPGVEVEEAVEVAGGEGEVVGAGEVHGRCAPRGQRSEVREQRSGR